MQAALQVVYVAMSAYGWFAWRGHWRAAADPCGMALAAASWRRWPSSASLPRSAHRSRPVTRSRPHRSRFARHLGKPVRDLAARAAHHRHLALVDRDRRRACWTLRAARACGDGGAVPRLLAARGRRLAQLACTAPAARMTDAGNDDAIAAAARALGLRARPEIAPLDGGIANRTFRLRAPGQDLVLKSPAKRATRSAPVARSEYAMQALAAGAGLAPPVVLADPGRGFIVSRARGRTGALGDGVRRCAPAAIASARWIAALHALRCRRRACRRRLRRAGRRLSRARRRTRHRRISRRTAARARTAARGTFGARSARGLPPRSASSQLHRRRRATAGGRLGVRGPRRSRGRSRLVHRLPRARRSGGRCAARGLRPAATCRCARALRRSAGSSTASGSAGMRGRGTRGPRAGSAEQSRLAARLAH